MEKKSGAPGTSPPLRDPRLLSLTTDNLSDIECHNEEWELPPSPEDCQATSFTESTESLRQRKSYECAIASPLIHAIDKDGNEEEMSSATYPALFQGCESGVRIEHSHTPTPKRKISQKFEENRGVDKLVDLEDVRSSRLLSAEVILNSSRDFGLLWRLLGASNVSEVLLIFYSASSGPIPLENKASEKIFAFDIPADELQSSPKKSEQWAAKPVRTGRLLVGWK